MHNVKTVMQGENTGTDLDRVGFLSGRAGMKNCDSPLKDVSVQSLLRCSKRERDAFTHLVSYDDHRYHSV